MAHDPESRAEKVPVTLSTYEEQHAEGTIELLHLSDHERNARSRKWLIYCLVIAPVTVICPPHIPWPIVTIAVGIIGYFLRRGRKDLVTGGEGTCPKCGAHQTFEAGNAEFPMAHFCSQCHERSLVAPSVAA